MHLPFAGAPAPVRRPPPASVDELVVRAAALAGRRVGELAAALGVALPPDERRAKGFVGMLAERALGADPTAGDRPDFPDLGVELKTVPVRPDGAPAESTFCCSVTMAQSDREQWESSRLCRRLACVLWLPVQSSHEGPLPERRFGRAVLWRPDAADVALLRADWEDLMGALGAGRQVDAREGRVLQLRPKAADGRVRSLGPAGEGAAPVAPMGFYLRPSFTARVLAGSGGDSAIL